MFSVVSFSLLFAASASAQSWREELELGVHTEVTTYLQDMYGAHYEAVTLSYRFPRYLDEVNCDPGSVQRASVARLGRTSWHVPCNAASGRSHLRVLVDVVARVEMPVLQERSRRGEKIDLINWVRKSVLLDRDDGFLVDPKVCYVPSKTLKSNEPVKTSWLDICVDFAKGSIVRLLGESRGVSVEVAATLEEDANVGQLVSVVNVTTGHRVEGYLEHGGVVRLNR
ncbi:flagella basal body P-ring formation protein FlgA [Vibrio sp. PNB22_3_1]